MYTADIVSTIPLFFVLLTSKKFIVLCAATVVSLSSTVSILTLLYLHFSLWINFSVISALSVFALYAVLKWKREHITPASIKEGLDRLPAGLCYHNEKGVPKLINHRMDGLCRYITGEPLFDGNELWRRLTKGEVLPGNTVVKWGENPIITLSDGNTLSFTKIEREIGGKKLYEIRATDITKQYALNLELQRNNNELRSLNTRLQEYGENVYDITREREILTAKVNIHDMLGKALLVTKRYIDFYTKRLIL